MIVIRISFRKRFLRQLFLASKLVGLVVTFGLGCFEPGFYEVSVKVCDGEKRKVLTQSVAGGLNELADLATRFLRAGSRFSTDRFPEPAVLLSVMYYRNVCALTHRSLGSRRLRRR